MKSCSHSGRSNHPHRRTLAGDGVELFLFSPTAIADNEWVITNAEADAFLETSATGTVKVVVR